MQEEKNRIERVLGATLSPELIQKVLTFALSVSYSHIQENWIHWRVALSLIQHTRDILGALIGAFCFVFKILIAFCFVCGRMGWGWEWRWMVLPSVVRFPESKIRLWGLAAVLTLPLLLVVRIRIGWRGSGAFQMPFPTESPPWKGVSSLLLLEFSNSLLYSLVPEDIPDRQISGLF